MPNRDKRMRGSGWNDLTPTQSTIYERTCNVGYWRKNYVHSQFN